MQYHTVTAQHEAVKKLQEGKPEDIPERQFEIIRRKAATAWPADFEMRLHEEQTQFNAWRKLRNAEQPDMQRKQNISAELLQLEKTKLRLSIIPRLRFGRAMSNPESKTITLVNNGNGRAKVESIEVVSV